MGLGRATALFIPLVLLVIWLGTRLPQPVVAAFLRVHVKQWEVILLVYCFIASLLPMWLLLQPRGYLGGWFLYLTMAVALFGALFGGFRIEYPAFNVEGLRSLANGRPLIPILFITVACGACSGFHGIVASGTTSKQICRESDTRPVGYGAMILEGVVAVLALATLMIIPAGHGALTTDPNIIFGKGIASYMRLIGIDFNLALAFALLAFLTFVYDTLDVCTRLARYILQELFGWRSWPGRALATFITLVVPAAFLAFAHEKAYLVAWPIFGTSNQLLASLTLLAISVWLIRTGRNALFALVPMGFMLVMTLWSLVLQIAPFAAAVVSRTRAEPDVAISGICGIVLLVLSVWLLIEATRILARHRGFAVRRP
jgi:carbon starvation protein